MYFKKFLSTSLVPSKVVKYLQKYLSTSIYNIYHHYFRCEHIELFIQTPVVRHTHTHTTRTHPPHTRTHAIYIRTTMSTITHKSLTYRILVYLSNIGLNTTVSSTYKQDELCMLLSDTQKWFGDTHACMHVSQHQGRRKQLESGEAKPGVISISIQKV